MWTTIGDIFLQKHPGGILTSLSGVRFKQSVAIDQFSVFCCSYGRTICHEIADIIATGQTDRQRERCAAFSLRKIDAWQGVA